VAKKILSDLGIKVASYVKELAGVRCSDSDSGTIIESTDSYKRMRHDHDPFYQEIYIKGRISPDMRFLEKMAILAQVEKEIEEIRGKAPALDDARIRGEYKVHPVLNCPDIEAADSMVTECNKISATGDSAGGLVEVIVTGMPAGVGEPVFSKLDGELGKLMGIGAVKGVEIGAGFAAKDMTGYQCNDQMRSEKGKVVFDSNNAGGITGGLTTGQDIIIRLSIKPTPTIDKGQDTIDKYTLENKKMAAITRRDPTIVARIWPVAENLTALIILDNLVAHFGYQKLLDLYNK
jgi:chorismate synthase